VRKPFGRTRHSRDDDNKMEVKLILNMLIGLNWIGIVSSFVIGMMKPPNQSVFHLKPQSHHLAKLSLEHK
jgi:hypothetical protein